MEMIGTLPILKQHSQMLEESLRDSEYGCFYTFKELSDMAGIDVIQYRSVMESVKKSLLKNYNRLLINVRGKGYQVAVPSQYSAVMTKGIKTVGRKIKSIKNVGENIQWTKLDKDQTKSALEAVGKTQLLSGVYKTVSVARLGKNIDWGRVPNESTVIALLLSKKEEK